MPEMVVMPELKNLAKTYGKPIEVRPVGVGYYKTKFKAICASQEWQHINAQKVTCSLVINISYLSRC